MRQCTEEQFRKDVSAHGMEVLLDNGIHRHLKFSANGSFNMHFDIVTWPGYLAISGDMGCFVFSRLRDMFDFFRSDKPALEINCDYWAEKLESTKRHGGAMVYDPDRFTEQVEQRVKDWIEECELTKEQAEELRSEVREEVLCADDNEYDAHRNLSEFSLKLAGHRFEFHDTWEWDLKAYTYHYVWCCFAIVWAIRQYDARNEISA